MAESKKFDEGLNHGINDSLILMIEYIMEPYSSVRSLAKKHGISKTKAWRILRFFSAKFDTKLAKMIYAKAYLRQTYCDPPKISDADMRNLQDAHNKLLNKEVDFKTIRKMKISFLLWH